MSQYVKAMVALMVVALVASGASAALIARWDEQTTAAGHHRDQLVIDTTYDWLSAELLVELSTGSNVPSPAPTMNLGNPDQSYLTDGTDTQYAGVSIGGGALTIGGAISHTFDVSLIDVTWFTTTTSDIGTGLILANIVLTDNAAGTWACKVYNGGPTVAQGDDETFSFSGTIVGGALVPEPATLCLLGVGGAVALLKRRR